MAGILRPRALTAVRSLHFLPHDPSVGRSLEEGDGGMTENSTGRHRAGRGRWLKAAALVVLCLVGTAFTIEETLDARVQQLREDLRSLVESSGRRSSRYSVLALSLETGDTLYSGGAHDLLAPASNMKLLTTATALRYLGPDFRYQTFLLADGPIEQGRLKGDLVLYGTGDPGLSDEWQGTKILEALADSLGRAGVQVIEGDIVGDGSFFSGPLLGEGWNPDDMNDWFTAPSSALTFDENMVTLRVVPSSPGLAPEIHTIPGGADVPMQVTAVTGGGGGRVMIRRTDPAMPISIEGSLSANGREVWRQMTVQDPPRFAASVFRSVLEEHGILVMGTVSTVTDASASSVTSRSLFAPGVDSKRTGARIIAIHRSPPLLDYLKIINKKSHNLFADLTLKTLGRIVAGQGSFAAGSAVVHRFLANEVKTDTLGIVMHDGSGLSALSRVSAATFVDVLKHMSRTPLWDPYWETLPEAGNPRELRRMYQTPAAGNLRAKTGTIEHVSALSGIVRSANGERILFSIIANDVPSTGGAKMIEDRIAVELASFERPFQPVAEIRAANIDSLGAEPVAASVAAAPTPEPAPPPAPVVALAPAAPSPAGVASARPPASAPRTHRVVAGDNLTVIARRYGVTLNALMAANPRLTPRRLIPGVELKIPAADQGDDPTPPAERVDVKVHVVKSGESLDRIARTYGVSVNDLIKANPTLDPRRLQIGERVNIPAGN